MRKQVETESVATPASPYSQGIVAEGPMVYVAGQGPSDPTGKFLLGSFQEQAGQSFHNVGAILEAAGSSWEDVVKVNVYLANIGDFAEMNEIYSRFVKPPYPARTTVEAAFAVQGMLIEVDCVALVSR
jgi:2-iminobutanoate/2-iminopropanoate deaminase